MFIRVHRSRRLYGELLSFVLIQSERVFGRVKKDTVALVGSIRSTADEDTRRKFWAHVDKLFFENFEERDRVRFAASIEKHVPRHYHTRKKSA